MSLIDSTYFEKRLLAIPNLNKDEVEDQLNDYISVFEDVYLDKMLGVKLKNDFLTGLGAEPIDQWWLDLRDGKEYVVSDVTYRWRGFVNDEKISPIANYIFCNINADNQNQNTGLGDARANAENSTVIRPHYRIGSVWTEMAQLNTSLVHFLNEFKDQYYSDWVIDIDTPLLKNQNVIGL